MVAPLSFRFREKPSDVSPCFDRFEQADEMEDCETDFAKDELPL